MNIHSFAGSIVHAKTVKYGRAEILIETITPGTNGFVSINCKAFFPRYDYKSLVFNFERHQDHYKVAVLKDNRSELYHFTKDVWTELITKLEKDFKDNYVIFK